MKFDSSIPQLCMRCLTNVLGGLWNSEECKILGSNPVVSKWRTKHCSTQKICQHNHCNHYINSNSTTSMECLEIKIGEW